MLQHPVRCWVLEASESSTANHANSISCTGYQNSIACVTTFILEKLITSEIPHNLIISNSGKTFYIIPRKFDSKDFPINTSWNNLGGLMTFRSSSAYEDYSANDVADFLREKVGFDQADFGILTDKLLEEFTSVYVIEKHNQ